MKRPSPRYRRRMDLSPPPVVIGAAKGAPLSRQDSSRSRLCVRLVDVLTPPRCDLIAYLLSLWCNSQQFHVFLGVKQYRVSHPTA
jgi:hypothetical protein